MTSYGAFTLLWQKLLRSSIWVKESKETRLVWIALLAMKDQDGRIFSSVIGLADAAKVSEAECREALRVLLAPDPDDTSGVKEGRRIEEIQGGWVIVNHELYRFSTEAKRVVWAEQKRSQRSRKGKAHKVPNDGYVDLNDPAFQSQAPPDHETRAMIREDLPEYLERKENL